MRRGVAGSAISPFMLAGFTSSFHSPAPLYLRVFLPDLIFFLLFKFFFVQSENNSMERYNRLELSYRQFFELEIASYFYYIYTFKKLEKDSLRRDRNKKFSCASMNIYIPRGGGPGIRQEIST